MNSGLNNTAKSFLGCGQHMFNRVVKSILTVSMVLSVTACNDNPVFGRNGNFRLKDAGPDEFAVVPTKELELPEDLAVLPEPTPGARNRVDQRPEQDAIVALGGDGDSLDSNLIRSDEQALVASVSRYGVTGDIRASLAAEDEEFRGKKNGKWIGRTIFPKGHYLRQYKGEALEAYEEHLRLQRLGVRTTSVPQQE